jgi:hypothetical protein
MSRHGTPLRPGLNDLFSRSARPPRRLNMTATPLVIDVTVPTSARMYDYWLSGHDYSKRARSTCLDQVLPVRYRELPHGLERRLARHDHPGVVAVLAALHLAVPAEEGEAD